MRAVVQNKLISLAILASATLHGLTLLGSTLLWTVIYLMVAQVEYDRFSDPTGQYEAVLTYPKLYHVMPMMPGQGGDKSGKITIYDRHGTFYGSGSLDVVRHGHSLEWTDHGASLLLVGQWDFEAGTYAYWSNDGNELIVQQVRW